MKPFRPNEVIAECIEKPGWWRTKRRKKCIASLFVFGNNNSNQFDPSECTLIPKQWVLNVGIYAPKAEADAIVGIDWLFCRRCCCWPCMSVRPKEETQVNQSITISTMNGKDTLAHDERKENYTWCMFEVCKIRTHFHSILVYSLCAHILSTLHRRSDAFNLCLLRVKWKGYLMFG